MSRFNTISKDVRGAATIVTRWFITVHPGSSNRDEPAPYAQVTHSRIGRRISHGYDPASFVAIRIGP